MRYKEIPPSEQVVEKPHLKFTEEELVLFRALFGDINMHAL